MAQEIDIIIDTGQPKDISVELKGRSSQDIPAELEKVTNYEKLSNKPRINGVELVGNKTAEDLGIEMPDVSGFATKSYVDQQVGDIETLLNNINSGG